MSRWNPQKASERIYDLFSPEPNSGCWLWTGFISRFGYGSMSDDSRKTRAAHRLVYQLLVGDIPAGMQLDHLCRVRSCVNPRHLEPVTAKVNIRRGNTGLHLKSRTHCPYGHPYSVLNTYWVKKSDTVSGFSRTCRECKRQRNSLRVGQKMFLPEGWKPV